MGLNVKAKLVIKEQLKPDIFKFGISAKEIANIAKLGQFLEIRDTDNIVPFLRRPISIYNVDKQNGIVEFIFQVKGNGTKILSSKNIGDEIDIVGPLGNGTFNIYENKKIAILGGGIGVFPLHELAKNLKDKSEVNVYLGFKNKDAVVLEDEFKKVSDKVVITTDDGSYGIKGFAINELEKDIEDKKIEYIYACGPLPMLKAIRNLSIEKNIPCQISLEEKMACGLGVCLGCAVKKANTENDKTEYTYVCRNGPVFNAKSVEI